MNNDLEIKKLSKEFVDETGFRKNLFQNISFDVEKNSFTTVLAPTGMGKSSFLKIISGLETQSSGEIIKKEDTKIIYIPTEPSSFPWMTVKENISFALDDKRDIKKYINIVGLDGYEDHIPHNKSLGFRFRISLARALAIEPSIIVLDEPFNKMDIKTKAEIYSLVNKINCNEKQTMLLGTTNITEAIYLSDKIILMKKDPAEILEEIKIEFDKERNYELLDKDEFHLMRTRIEKIYKQHQSQKLFNLSI